MTVNSNFTPGQVLTAAQLNSAFGSAASQTDMAQIQNGTATDAGTLTGAETVSASRGSGLLQTTLSKIATFFLATFTFQLISTTGIIGRTLLAVLADLPLSVKWFGAKGDGSTDDTTAIAAAGTYATSAGRTLWAPDGVYCTTGVSLACALDMSPGAKFIYIGADNGTALTLSASNVVHGRIAVDGNAKNVAPIVVSGSYNRIQDVFATNVTATSTGSLSLIGISFTGGYNVVKHAHVTNMVNAGHPNVSFPQGILAYGAENVIENIVFSDVRSGLVLSTAVTTYVNNIVGRNMADNGIYQLTGILRCGRLEYSGSEEPAVFEGSGNVNDITIIGSAFGVGFQNCGDFTIGRLNVQPDANGNTAGYLFRTRVGSTTCGIIRIGRIDGTLKGSSLFSASSSNGTVAYLNIGSMDVTFQYDASICTSPASFGDLTGCNGIKFDNPKVTLIDANNVNNSTIFNISLGTLTKESYVRGMNMPAYESDGVTISNLQIRGVNFAQALMATQGVCWRTDIGPYIVENTASTAAVDSASQAPTAGSWLHGKYLWNVSPAASGTSGWVCVSSGTPGTWKTFGTIGA